MSAVLSLITALVSLLFLIMLARQYRQRRKPHQLVWALALFFFGAGAACQFIAARIGWSPLLYRVWYLCGAILTAAYLGQGTLYLQAGRRRAHIVMAVLLLASAGAAVVVWRAPVDLSAALVTGVASGKGMPRYARLMTPFFNIFGTVALVGGAVRSSWFFLWSGRSDGRALGTALIAAGALLVAFGGTLARFSRPEALYLSELLGVVTIFGGFILTSRPGAMAQPAAAALDRRRRRIARTGVVIGATFLLGAVASLPLMPWPMGIVTDAQHVYIDAVPAENKGAYLVSEDGVMQLYTWRVEPADFPGDAPTLASGTIDAVAIVQKQYDPPADYLLYDLTTDRAVPWQQGAEQDGRLVLQPPALSAGDYMLVVPTDSMFGGKTWHYFHLR
jgi:hypothetical protein